MNMFFNSIAREVLNTYVLKSGCTNKPKIGLMCNMLPKTSYLGSLSFWHLVSALQRLGSGQRSSGVWFFLFLSERSAPLAAKKHAIDAEDFLSAPWLPRQIRSCNERREARFREEKEEMKAISLHKSTLHRANYSYRDPLFL